MSTLQQNDWFYKGTRKKNGISLSTSNGNMVSPPSSTLDKYNKKEATCKIEYDNMNNEQWQFHHHEHEEFFIFNKTSLLFFFFFKWSNTCRVWWNNEPKTICTFSKPTTLSISHIILITQCKAYQRRIYK